LPKSAQKIRSGGALRFGYVGGNSRVKGVHHVTKVFAELGRSDIKLVVADNANNLGFSSYEESDFKGIPHVEIVPGYTQATIDRFFDSIDVLLFPTQAKESFGLVVREALVRNVWVISTDSGGAVEDIRPGENGLVIPMNDDGTALKQAVLE